MIREKATTVLFLAILLSSSIPFLARADYDNFPVKSVNIGKAPKIKFYEAIRDDGPKFVLDPHPVHGIQTSDGGYVFVGKGEVSGKMEGFAVKLNSLGKIVFSYISKNKKYHDGINSVIESPNGDLFLAGYFGTSNGIHRELVKLSSNGKKIWSFKSFGDKKGSNGAWETIDLNANGDLLLGGFCKKPNTEEYAFKSYGNAPGGKPVVMKIPFGVVASNSVDQGNLIGASKSFVQNDGGHMTCKAVRPTSNGKVAVLLWGEEMYSASVMVLDIDAGKAVWGPTKYASKHGEATDMVVASDGGFAFTGHGTEGKTLVGRLTKISSSGKWMFTKSFSSAGSSNKYIKNECWGLQKTKDNGFVLACGTGIENCGGMSGTLLKQCKQGKPLAVDNRPGAYSRQASVWQSLIVKTDASGTLLWQRVDQYRRKGEPKLGSPNWERHSSASEHVALCSDGSLVFVNDESIGIGILKLAAENDSKDPVKPTPKPTTKNAPSPTKPPTKNDDVNAECDGKKKKQCNKSKGCAWKKVGRKKLCKSKTNDNEGPDQPKPKPKECGDINNKKVCNKQKKVCRWKKKQCREL